MEQKIEPSGPLKGTLVLPGDKSVSHRALILAAMAKDVCEISGLAPGEDVAFTARCLRQLGSPLENIDSSSSVGRVRAGGIAWQLGTESAALDSGNSASTMRLLAGALSGKPGRFSIDGDESLRRRPMKRVTEPLGMMGATVETTEGRPPITIEGGKLTGIHYELPVASAQVKGAILLAALQAEGPTVIDQPIPSRDHTERFLHWLGVDITWGGTTVTLEETFEGLPLPNFALSIPGDFSSAAFALTAASIIQGSELSIGGVGVNFTRTGLIDVLRSMGGGVVVVEESEEPEPAGSIYVRQRPLSASTIKGEVVARMIDEIPLIAVAATQAEGTTVISDASELRVKEADRIASLVVGLREMGAQVDELEDGMVVTGPTPLKGARVDPRGDHRIAMAFAVAGLVAAEPVSVIGWECTRISYPTFLEDLARLR